jgi:eukaryotic-like serine/threonine-protein kinase
VKSGACQTVRLFSTKPLYERALAIWENALGPEHPDVATSLNGLGTVAKLRGKYEQARALYERALAIREKVLGPEHSDVAASLHNLGVVADSLGEHERARALLERALAIWEKALGPEHPNVAYPLTSLGETLLALAKPTDALPLLERALAIRTTHQVDPALPLLERALAIRTTHQVDPALLAGTRFALARALWTAPAPHGRDQPRARTLAEQARDAYAPLGDAQKTELTEAQAWLADHPL